MFIVILRMIHLTFVGKDDWYKILPTPLMLLLITDWKYRDNTSYYDV